MSIGAIAALALAAGCSDGDNSGSSEPTGTVVRPGDSIQSAVDAAAPGDTITVMPGDYTETHAGTSAVHITKPLKLIAQSDPPDQRVRILPSAGQRDGIVAEPANTGDPDIDGLTISGFTIEGFSNNGIWLKHVQNFTIEKNESINNLENGIWPTISANGEVRNNVAYGSLDSALWVEASENVRILDNDLHHSPTGLEITVSNDIHMEGNDVHDNVVGVGLYHPSGAGLPPSQWPPSPFRNWTLVNNKVNNNNFPNPVSSGLVGALPSGGGVLVLGVDTVDVRDNEVNNNNFFGIAVVDYCIAVDGTPNSCQNNPPFYTDVSPDGNRLVDNTATGNGAAPPPGPFEAVAGDLLAIGGTNNCASGNTANKVTFAPELPPC
ncbi:MAG TPA: right-handed parallel beta-helix repeat-containing protein [Candidatus Binatia bacterium]|nr:right-handed parallel beta-helix repeat-containing protein [Candidatus Binatia bacterium]